MEFNCLKFLNLPSNTECFLASCFIGCFCRRQLLPCRYPSQFLSFILFFPSPDKLCKEDWRDSRTMLSNWQSQASSICLHSQIPPRFHCSNQDLLFLNSLIQVPRCDSSNVINSRRCFIMCLTSKAINMRQWWEEPHQFALR